MKSKKLFGNIILNKMILVVDPNVIISAVLNIGNSLNVFILNKIIKKFDFVAPEFLFIELGKHTEKLAKKSRFTLDNAKEIIEFLIKEIEIIPEYQFKDKFEDARKILKEHQKDVPYLALALKLNCDIFSGDKILKKLIPNRVVNPKEMLDKIYYN
ncbi:MAG: PIN domain-containing protein [Nanoarchaeota archaeon]